MKKTILILLLAMAGFSGYAQTYQAITSKNKTYLETLKGVSYTYKDGVVTLKNNGNYDLGTVSVIASSKVDSTLFGIALFEEGLEKGATVKAEVYFTVGNGKASHDVALKQVNQKALVLSFDKATRAIK
ncbi:hypothetical protein ASE74_17200 [Pedobacter sp. Leaf216]|uniref:hypothetical protein n=1 Tax=Pedobacter sp. Leaf216 TaxID=1735684 RepID=UPI0006F51A83|nr:hypothetical protein [Pedobacter sp. Leaf216]KQM77004.1 hypothetical protein ASE74_17200 [Pedobacter sp. Leaf216]